MNDYYREIIEYIKENKPSKDKLTKEKIVLCKKLRINEIPTDINILLRANKEELPLLRRFLISKPTRTGSGVAVVAVMTKPLKCPHGKCMMCPGGVKSHYGSVPQSYTGLEPATLRAKRNHYDPYLQIFNRLEQYVILGQSPEKVELIIMGGTFPSFPKKYKDEFVNYSFKAMNDFSDLFFSKGEFQLLKFKEFFELPGELGCMARTKRIHKKLLKLKMQRTKSLEKEQTRNEKSNIKCIGLTIETRPDFGLLEHGHELLRLGCTRVELGVQSVYEKALANIERGHDVITSILSTRILKDLGFKINYHYMLGLPGITLDEDIKGLKELFSNPDFRPDMLKIYPCMVMPGTKLYSKYKKGKFNPITTKQAMVVLAELKKIIPKYVRIMRVQRDIPTKATTAGVDRNNLRQLLQPELEKQNIKCSCIRCREIKAKEIKGKVDFEIIEYDASSGKEFFISLVNKDSLIGFARLRLPSSYMIREIDKDSAILRELHVYGPAEEIGKKGDVQHRGFGGRLLKKAEEIAKKQGKKRMVVISGVGAREYYRKFGYEKGGPYMIKKIK